MAADPKAPILTTQLKGGWGLDLDNFWLAVSNSGRTSFGLGLDLMRRSNGPGWRWRRCVS